MNTSKCTVSYRHAMSSKKLNYPFSCYYTQAAVQDTLNESEGRPLVYNQPQSQPQERPPTVDTQPFVQR